MISGASGGLALPGCFIIVKEGETNEKFYRGGAVDRCSYIWF